MKTPSRTLEFIFHPRFFCLFLAVVLPSTQADAQTKRRVFVLHSGMHVILAPADKDHAARTLTELLGKRGIAQRDLVPIDSPFPTASSKDPIPKQGLLLYLDSADPKSKASQDAYLRMHKALKDKGVAKTDDLVWIGHSAGGQIGMTMAHIAHNLDKFPELARQAQPFHFDTVITLGSAIGSNPVPKEVKLRHYCSPADTMVLFLSLNGDMVADAMKSKVRFRQCYDPGPNVLVRVFPGIEHPNWYADDQILACILAEFNGQRRPAWRLPQAESARGIGLGQLMAQALESELRISLEEPR